MAARWAAYLARWREHLHGVQPPIRRPSGTSVSVWSADDSASPMTPGLATDSRPEAADRLGGCGGFAGASTGKDRSAGHRIAQARVPGVAAWEARPLQHGARAN